MAVLRIHTYPDPILKQIAKPVEKVTPELVEFAHNMLETMYAAPGIGLAAPQVGQSIRLLVIDIRVRGEDGNVDESQMTEMEKQVKFPLIFFNPEILEASGKTTFEEGCLSVPGYVEEVSRAAYVEMTYTDVNGEKQTLKTDGLLAVCVQHEIDHLEGIVFIDRLSSVKRALIKSKIKKHGYEETDPRHVL